MQVLQQHKLLMSRRPTNPNRYTL